MPDSDLTDDDVLAQPTELLDTDILYDDADCYRELEHFTRHHERGE